MGAGFELTVLLQHRGGVGFLLHLKFPLQDLRFKSLAFAKINASETGGICQRDQKILRNTLPGFTTLNCIGNEIVFVFAPLRDSKKFLFKKRAHLKKL